ncbi:MAG: carboxypeptidase-like regulatory domain-containing protein, partial [Pedobacter sp.]|nr:carboxypeptidase-like regulatory domain-containing protein [Pedobacter sp.]
MKKHLLVLAACLLSLAACKKDRLDEVQPIQATFQLNYTTAVKDLGLPLANAEIKLTNKLDGKVNTAKSNANGVVVFESITPGNYSAVASLTISAADYSNLTGTVVAQDIVFNASLEANIVAGAGTMQLTLQSGKLGDWVIKQVYYGGSSSSNGALFRDQFLEIYNNSTEVLYADSLYIALIYGKNTKVSGVD